MKFYTKYSKRVQDREKVSTERVVKVAGYVPPDVQIKRMIQAGEVFQLNAQAYDVGKFVADEVMSFNKHYQEVMEMAEDDFQMRRPDSDIIDATEKMREINIRRQQASALARRLINERQNVQDLAEAALQAGQNHLEKSEEEAKA